MQYGIRLPHYLTDGSPDRVAATAREAERLGFDSIWVVDHLLIPADPERSWGWSYYDPFVTLGQVAAITDRVKLGTSVIVLPYRPPIVSAKLVAALDQVSGGRLILGVGAGALIEEFDALGVPFAERGARTDEALEVWRALFTQDVAEYAGRWTSFRHVKFEPKPLQRPSPPIWVGGNSPAAIRRAIRHGDAWHPLAMRFDRMEVGVADLRSGLAAAGRDPASCRLTLTFSPRYADRPAGRDARRRPGAGTPEEIADDLRRYAALGFEFALLDMLDDIPNIERSMERFLRDVAPLVAA